jgi:hypothetical protein
VFITFESWTRLQTAAAGSAMLLTSRDAGSHERRRRLDACLLDRGFAPGGGSTVRHRSQYVRAYFVTSVSMIWFAIFSAWLALAGFFVALCRATGASSVVRREAPLPTNAVPSPIAAGLVVWEEPANVEAELRRLMLRDRGARPRGAPFAA